VNPDAPGNDAVGCAPAARCTPVPTLLRLCGTSLSKLHNTIKHLKPVKAIIRGFLVGFIGLLAAVTLPFALKSLIGWQTWLVFCSSLALLRYFKKDVPWAIAGTATITSLIFR
jgi:chromate transport protein ChrA